MIGQYPKAEVVPFLSVEIGIRKLVLKDICHREQMGESHAKLRAKKQNRGFQDSS